MLLDHGANPDYAFDDLGNLVRRVRIDFGAKIEPLPSLYQDRLGIDEGWRTAGLTGLRRDQVGDMGVAMARHSLALLSLTYAAALLKSLLFLASLLD